MFNNGGGSITDRLESWIRQNPITTAITFICVVIWLAEMFLSDKFVQAGVFESHLALQEPWRWVTSIFFHAPDSPAHIFFNMFAFVSTGALLEKILGWKKYLILFFCSGVGGNLAMFLWGTFVETKTIQYSLGASGAIFGLFGALIILFKHLGVNNKQLITTVVLNIMILTFIIPGIAWQAHVGGLITGLIVGIIYVRFTKIRTTFY
jgi:membrane associated rhomboid family serine protease